MHSLLNVLLRHSFLLYLLQTSPDEPSHLGAPLLRVCPFDVVFLDRRVRGARAASAELTRQKSLVSVHQLRVVLFEIIVGPVPKSSPYIGGLGRGGRRGRRDRLGLRRWSWLSNRLGGTSCRRRDSGLGLGSRYVRVLSRLRLVPK